MGLLFLLVFGLIFAFACSTIAAGKGLNATKWAWIGFFLGIIGLIMVACMPANPERKVS